MRPKMKAAVLYGREDVRIEQVEVPALEPGDVLLRTRVALTCGTDAKVFRRGYHAKMIVPPAVFGHEMAGIVEEVAPGVESFEPGMAVVAANSAPCGDCYYCRHEMPSLCDDLLFWNGAYAEFARIPARVVKKNLLALDEGLEFREAAMVEPLACVIRRKSWIGRGQSRAVIGPAHRPVRRPGPHARAHVTAAGRAPGWTRRWRWARGVAAGVARTPQPHRSAAPTAGMDVVIEARLPATSEAAVRGAQGIVQLFAAARRIPRSGSTRLLHYQELTIKSTFHHTPESVRKAFRLIADGHIDPNAFITADASLDDLPQVLGHMARGGDGLKTAILP